jgi:GNAT superfamily N-acetyltransferase
MSATTSYRPAEAPDAKAISTLVRRSLTAETMPGWSPKAMSSLLAKAAPEAMREEIAKAAFACVASNHRAIAGYVLAKRSRFLNLVVVDPSLQRRGIGSHLVRRMLEYVNRADPDLSVVEVNATEYSLPFYRRLGFYPLSEFIEFDGCRFARLGYWRKNPLLSQCKS